MLTNAPLAGPLNVIKAFGPSEQPDGPAQRGHLGIDLAAAVGAEVLAVQGGSVLRVIDDHPVWGRVVVLGHEWGQSVYAGLGGIKVVGGSAEAGQVLGVDSEIALHDLGEVRQGRVEHLHVLGGGSLLRAVDRARARRAAERVEHVGHHRHLHVPESREHAVGHDPDRHAADPHPPG